MDAWTIARQFIHRDNRWMRCTCLQGYTPPDWWECDIFEISAAGYFVEYEIKLSRSDYFVDAKKARLDWPKDGMHYDPVTQSYPKPPLINKHALLAASDLRGPSKFYFMVPTNLIGTEEVPAWAGLFYVERFRDSETIIFTKKKDAPFIHKSKASESLRNGVFRSCYGRYHMNRNGTPVCSSEPVLFEGPEGAD